MTAYHLQNPSGLPFPSAQGEEGLIALSTRTSKFNGATPRSENQVSNSQISPSSSVYSPGSGGASILVLNRYACPGNTSYFKSSRPSRKGRVSFPLNQRHPRRTLPLSSFASASQRLWPVFVACNITSMTREVIILDDGSSKT